MLIEVQFGSECVKDFNLWLPSLLAQSADPGERCSALADSGASMLAGAMTFSLLCPFEASSVRFLTYLGVSLAALPVFAWPRQCAGKEGTDISASQIAFLSQVADACSMFLGVTRAEIEARMTCDAYVSALGMCLSHDTAYRVALDVAAALIRGRRENLMLPSLVPSNSCAGSLDSRLVIHPQLPGNSEKGLCGAAARDAWSDVAWQLGSVLSALLGNKITSHTCHFRPACVFIDWDPMASGCFGQAAAFDVAHLLLNNAPSACLFLAPGPFRRMVAIAMFCDSCTIANGRTVYSTSRYHQSQTLERIFSTAYLMGADISALDGFLAETGIMVLPKIADKTCE